MMRSLPIVLVSLGVAAGAVGCNGFLTGDKLSENPNQPAAATRDQLFVGVQAFQTAEQESAIPLLVCMWMQQCTGTGVRFVSVLGRYGVKETDFTTNFSAVYAGGGLVDLRSIEQSARADGDNVYLGIAKIWEALVIGTAADVWGSIPYTQAVGGVAQPDTDFQLVVYDSVQSLLTQAITDLGRPGTGPGANDLIYGGNTTRWLEVANTLKARFFLHTAEVVGAAAYDSAVKYATNGISDTSFDFRTYHGSNPTERNMWYQFFLTTFGSDLVAGKPLVDAMNARSDPRLPRYFGRNQLGGYGGVDVNNPGSTPPNQVSVLNGSRNAPDFRQPIISYIENQLILAEASLMKTTPDPVSALQHLNLARAAVPLPALVGPFTNAALFDSVMTEKYISLFQTDEVWSDYKRTCVPGPIVLTPVASASVGDGKIPGRLYYGSDERNVNEHIPDPSAQGLHPGFRNPNDPNPCP